MITRTVSLLPTGTDFVRLVRSHVLGEGNHKKTLEVARGWSSSPAVEMELQGRAAVSVLNTTDPDSAALSPAGVSAQFIELFRSASIIGRMRDRMRQTPFAVAVPRESAASTVPAWVGEGNRKPVGRLTLDSVTLPPTKAALISIISQELARFSSPAAESVIRTSLVRSMRNFADNQLLDPAISAISGTRPASILNGAPSVTTTGSSLSQIQTDLTAMTALLETWENVVWTMQPRTLARIAAVGAGSILTFAGTQPLLLGFPVFTSTASPQQVALIDVGNVLLAEGGVLVDFSDQASVVMDDGGSPSSTTLTSLWQTNYRGVLVEMFIGYERAFDASAVYMTVTY